MNTAQIATPDQQRRLNAWLGSILLSTLALYGLLTWLGWLPAWIARGRVSIGTLTDRRTEGLVLLALIGVALYTLYAAGALLILRFGSSRHINALVWAGAIAASGVLLWSYPVTSTDVFDYFFRSRMAIEYGANPYLQLPRAFPDDPFLRYVGWPNAPSAYGPLWELISVALLTLGGGSLQNAILLYKALAIVTHLLCGWLIQQLIPDPQHKTLGAYLWLLSPLALWELAAIGHNDGLIVLALLAAIWAARADRHWLAVLALVAGALFKFLPAIFIPLIVLRWLRRQASWRRRGAVLAAAVALCALPTIAFYAPYWDVPANLAALPFADQIAAVWQGRATTLRNFAVREGFLHAAPLALLSYALQTDNAVAAINSLVLSLGLAPIDKLFVRSMISSLGTLLLAVGLLWQCWRVWFRNRDLPRAIGGLLLWYILAGSQWFQPWYLLWLLGIWALQPRRPALAWLTVWAMMAQASYLLQFIVLPNLKISGQTLQAQQLYLALIFGAPLLLWVWTISNRPQARSASLPPAA